MKGRNTDFMGDHYLEGMKRLVSISKKNMQADRLNAVNEEGSSKILARHVCQVCGNIWDANPEKKEGPKRCPACSSVLWNNNNLKRHRCKQCSHIWMSKLDDPLVCPSCKSKLWSKDAESIKCRSCGNIWKQKVGMGLPKGCPHCRSDDLVPELAECICERCGYSGKMKSDQISRCPICTSTLSIYKGEQGHRRRGKDGPEHSPGIILDSIGSEALTILESDIDDTRKIIELESKAGIDNTDAEILVRFRNGEDRVSIARVTDTSLNRVIKTVMHVHCLRGEERL